MPLPHRALEALLGLPFLERLARPQRNAIRLVNHLALYNCRNQLDLLAGTGLRCPPITSYLDRLIDFVRAYFATPKRVNMEEAEEFARRPPLAGGYDVITPSWRRLARMRAVSRRGTPESAKRSS